MIHLSIVFQDNLFNKTSKSYKRNNFLYFLQFNNSSSLLNIGSLIGGIPSTFLTLIQPQEILKTSQNKEFVKNILGAPDIVQKTFVTQVCEQHSCVFRDISSANHIKSFTSFLSLDNPIGFDTS